MIDFKNRYPNLLALSFALLSGCTLTQLDKVKLEDFAPEIAVPLVDANFTVQDILDNFETGGYIGQDSAGIIRLVYRGNVLELKGDELFQIPDISPVNLPLLSTGSNTTIALPSASGEQLSEIRFKSGNMSFTFSNPSNVNTATINLSLPNCTKNGQAMSLSKTLAPNQTLSESVDLAGYRALLANGDFQLSYNISSTLPLSQIDLTFSLSNAKYSYVEGNFKQIGVSLPEDSVALTIFRNLKQGSMQFTDPRVAFTFQNSYGVPMRVSANTLSALTQLGGAVNFYSPTYFNSNTNRHEFNFAYPSINEVGQSKSSTFFLNRQNSNLDDIIANLPYQVSYDLQVQANADNVTDNFFITDSSKLGIDVNVELPFTGKAKETVLIDTFGVDFTPFKMLYTAGFKTIIENSFPLTGKLQLYFYLNNGTLIDSMFTDSPTLFTAADNSNAQNLSPTETTKEAYFNETRFANVKKATRIVLKASLATLQDGQKEVSIYNTSGMRVKLGVLSSASLAGLVQ